MEFILWLIEHSQMILEPVGIVGSLLFTGISLRTETRARRVQNILTITSAHRDIWRELYDRPNLGRILKSHVDVEKHPPTEAETLFIRFVILHLSSVYWAIRADEILEPKGTQLDVQLFFSLPIPHSIWQEYKVFQDRDFVAWVEDAVAGTC